MSRTRRLRWGWAWIPTGRMRRPYPVTCCLRPRCHLRRCRRWAASSASPRPRWLTNNRWRSSLSASIAKSVIQTNWQRLQLVESNRREGGGKGGAPGSATSGNLVVAETTWWAVCDVTGHPSISIIDWLVMKEPTSQDGEQPSESLQLRADVRKKHRSNGKESALASTQHPPMTEAQSERGQSETGQSKRPIDRSTSANDKTWFNSVSYQPINQSIFNSHLKDHWNPPPPTSPTRNLQLKFKIEIQKRKLESIRSR